MLHLRIVSPADRTARVQDLLCADPAACNVIVLPGAAVDPPGDVVLVDVAREDGSVVVERLRALGIEHDGSIAVETVDTAISAGATRAIAAARGAPGDAVVWEQVEAKAAEEASLTWSYLGFLVLSSLMAAAALLTDSTIVLVGAMVLGPEFGPLAGVCVAVVQRRDAMLRRSLVALTAGFAVAIAVTYGFAELVFAFGWEPDAFSLQRGIALLISSPDGWAVLVATCAGIAGMLSLTTARSGALIGVLVSVTTLPAAAEVSLGAARGDWDASGGAAAQLGVNVATILVVGIATLTFQRAAHARRRRRHDRGA